MHEASESQQFAAFIRRLSRAALLEPLEPVPVMLKPSGSPVSELVSDEEERLIVAFLDRCGAQPPRIISAGIHMHPATVKRRLAHLQVLGVVGMIGRTKSLRYYLPQAARHGLN